MSLRHQRIQRRGQQKNLIRFALLAAATLLVMGILYQAVTNMQKSITNWNRDIQLVEYGTLQDKLSGQAIIINQENLIMAEADGRFENMVKDKGKVGKGALLGYLVYAQGKIPMHADRSGIFVRQTDGLEETYSTLSLQEINDDHFGMKTWTVSPDQMIATGNPVGKIVDSLHPTRLIMRFQSAESDLQMKAGQSVKLVKGDIDWGKAYLVDMKRDGDKIYAFLECDGFNQYSLGVRYVDLDVVINSYSGYLIPAKAVVENEGKKGIYCADGEDISFKPIRILKAKDDILVVEGLDVNDMVVKNPPSDLGSSANR